MKKVILILASLLLTAGPALSAPDDKLIVPGKRIGKWTLEMTIADLERMNGPGTRILFRAGDRPAADAARDFTQVTWKSIIVGAVTVDQKTVVALVWNGEGPYLNSVMVGWQLYKTDKGISLESKREQVLKAYGKPTAETSPGQGPGAPTQRLAHWADTRLIYDQVGIAFRFYADGTMYSLHVFLPGKGIWKF